MKERPILFSAPMVRALLNGTKTQTRRVVKDNEGPNLASEIQEHRELTGKPYCPYGDVGDRLWVREAWQGPLVDDMDAYRTEPSDYHNPDYCKYAADGGAPPEFMTLDDELVQRWRPSIHMFRWASRITLEIVGVRVERLQDMEGQTAFESDALNEGVNAIHHGDGEYFYSAFRNEHHPKNWCDPADAFRELWNSINGPGSWEANPWVWVVEFKVIKP